MAGREWVDKVITRAEKNAVAIRWGMRPTGTLRALTASVRAQLEEYRGHSEEAAKYALEARRESHLERAAARVVMSRNALMN